jgi:hypothetical protein
MEFQSFKNGMWKTNVDKECLSFRRCWRTLILWHRKAVKDGLEYSYSKHNVKAGSCNHCCLVKAMSFTYSEYMCVCVFCVCACVRACVCAALVIQHAKYMGSVWFHLWSVWLYHTFTLSHKRLDFRKKVTEHKMCVLSLQLCLKYFSF